MNIFFLICFILVLYWAWNADNEITFNNKKNVSKKDIKQSPKKTYIPIYQPEDLDSNPELKKIFSPKIIVINPIGSITNGKNYEVHFRTKELLISYRNSYSFKFIVSSVNDFNNLKSLIVDEMGFDFQVIERDKQYDFLSKEYGLNNFYYISSSSLDKNIKQDCYGFYNPKRIHQSEEFAEGSDLELDHTLETILRFIDNNESYSTFDALYRPD